MLNNNGFRAALLADTHLGYSARCRVHPASGLNMRVRDGMLALRETITQILEAEVDLVIHGGDLFHRSHPGVGEIVWARQQLDRLAKAGIPVVGNTGNHDASAERGKSPATAAVDDPDRGIDFVTEPYRIVRPVDGLAIHMVSHYGLAQAERLIPEPQDGVINILSSHGAAMLPGHEVFRCVDSPGEQPIGLDLLLDDRYVLKALGHYHGMDEIMPSVWYAGSSIRRGFSDPEGGRGWLLMTIEPDGRSTVERKYISQRPQFDLPRIDAAGLTGAQVEEQVRVNLDTIDLGDAIVRQVVTNCSTSVRKGMDQPELARLAKDTLMWMPDFRRPEPVAEAGERTVEGVSSSLNTAGSVDLPSVFTGWIGGWSQRVDLPSEMRPVVMTEGDRHLRAASADIEGASEFQAPPRAAGSPTATATEARDVTEPVILVGEATSPTVDAVTGEESPW